MANRFVNPFPQFLSSTPTVFSGGTLTFYAAGTSNPLDTYADAALTTPNDNPLTLDALGSPDTDIFLADAAYKVVLKDSDGNTIKTADNVWSSDYSTEAKFKSYNGNPNGNVAGNAGSSTVDADAVWDYANNLLYICTTTGTSSTAVWTVAAAVSPSPQGRLTVTTGTPIADNASGSGNVFYTPYTGSKVPLNLNGNGVFVPTTFSELTCDITSQTVSKMYDLFAWSDDGTIRLVVGPAWSSNTARPSGTGTSELERVHGFLVNKYSITVGYGATSDTMPAQEGTYVGSCYVSTGPVVIDGPASRHLWNMYNRTARNLQVNDSTDSWAYSTATIRQANAAAGNQVSVARGLDEDMVDVSLHVSAITTSAAGESAAGIGLDSTTAFSGDCFMSPMELAVTNQRQLTARYNERPGVGYHYLTWLEKGQGSNTQTWYGDNGGTDTLGGLTGYTFA